MTDNERVIFMASRAHNQYTYQQPYPKKKKKKHRRKNTGQFWVNATAFLVVSSLLLIALTICWKGVQFLWNGMESALDFLTPEDPVISIISTEPSEIEHRDKNAPVLFGVHNFTVYQGDPQILHAFP